MIRSGFSIRGLDPESRRIIMIRSLGRIVTDDISDVILFLASDEARYMCGSLVEVNEETRIRVNWRERLR